MATYGEAKEALTSLTRAIDTAADLIADRALLSELEVAEATRVALGLIALCESGVVALTTEAISRGTVAESTAAGAAQWIARLARGESAREVLGLESSGTETLGSVVTVSETVMTDESSAAGAAGVGCAAPGRGRPAGFVGVEPARARSWARLAEAGTLRRHDTMSRAVCAGAVSTGVAGTALRHVDTVVAVLPHASHDEVYGWFLQLDPGAGTKAVRELTRQVIHRYAPEGELDAREETLGRHERVSFTALPTGLVQIVAELSPDNAAVIRSALDALSGPSPTSSCCDDPHHRHADGATVLQADERSPAKRRADALMLLVDRGAREVDTDADIVTSGSAGLVVTIDWDALRGALRTLGRTEAGESLSPSTVRRLACDAGIVPMVLGARGEPLDVGRRRRLVSRGMRRAVIERDRGCTFPGCDRPPAWCQVHHVRPWSEGGETSLSNSALLCQSHHTVVHQRGYTADVSALGVTWDARPGSLGTARPLGVRRVA